jgi:phage tail sheath protein FI
MVDLTNQDGPAGPTVASYRKAVDVMAEKTDVDAQLVVIPGIRTPGVTDYALDAVENRFDALYIMDLPEIAIDGTVITGSDTIPSVTLTASTFKARQLDSSFGAAYYPDVVIPNPTTGIEEVAPASVAALGAFALNDKLAYPWFAPAGFTRGALASVIETQTKLSRDNMDTLYSANINPIATIPGSPSPIINGQKTLLNRASALDRVNVRRLLIEIRRRVKVASNQILFEPNRETTLARFSALVEPILKQIQAQSGVDRYLVKIDTTTTTQADVENNTIRGKIFVQPTKSIEFVSLDFVVTNAGATI